ncbi:zinc finger protein 135-like [Esox lucius]|uniref:C2H2-type domain-containing protein n=1 Tax=Esox lucius TaxID=8010 RepID=A0AAY5JYV2_ESOLU|nr:zinc finger protein 135-like [Esox lucius]
MSKLQLLNVFVTERLSAAAVEIFGAVEKTIAVYQEEIFRAAEENVRLRKLLDMSIKPETQLHSEDLQLLTPVVPPEQQNCEQEWSSSLGQEGPELKHIKQEQQKLRHNQKDNPQPTHLHQNQTEDDRECGDLLIIKTEEFQIELDRESYGTPETTSDPAPSVNPEGPASAEKPYRCKQCGKGFTRMGHLTIHLRIHTGEKPYQCKDCGKRFNRKHDLGRHARVHTGEKPCQCKDGYRACKRKMDLTLNMRSHTGDRT